MAGEKICDNDVMHLGLIIDGKWAELKTFTFIRNIAINDGEKVNIENNNDKYKKLLKLLFGDENFDYQLENYEMLFTLDENCRPQRIPNKRFGFPSLFKS